MTSTRTRVPRCLLVCALVVLALASAAQPSDAQAAGVDRWVATTAIPLRSVEPLEPLDDLRPLAGVVGAARAVALGEHTHGAHEPLALRNRVFRYLVESLGFTAIAVETGLPESRDIARFVEGGPGAPPIDDAALIAGQRFTWGFGNFAENAELLRWMRAYNDDASHRRKLRFYGIDLSLGGPQGSTPTPAAIDAALAYLRRVDPRAAADLGARFAPLVRFLPGEPGASMSSAQHDSLTAAIDALASRLDARRADYVARSSEPEYAWAHRFAVVARQADRVHRAQAPPIPGGGISPGAWREITARDSAMAENVRWVLEREGRDGRVLVFAHDMHVKNVPTVGGPWRLERPPRAMGQFLRAALGGRIVLIGTVGGPSPAGDSPSDLGPTLARARLPRFLLDLRRGTEDPSARSWLAQEHGMRVNGDAIIRLVPADAFDALIRIEALTPARRNAP